MSELSSKTLTLKIDKLQQLLSGLPAIGFRCERAVWVNSDVEANIQQIHLAGDRVDANRWVGLVVQAHKPGLVEVDLQRLGVCQRDDIVTDEQTKAELERDLRSAAKYWQQTIQPYIESEIADAVQWYVARNAHGNLMAVVSDAHRWNLTKQGRESPVPLDAFPDLATVQSGCPELLDKEKVEEHLRKVSFSPPADLSPDDAVRLRVEHGLAERRYMESLPEKPDMGGLVNLAFGLVTFDKIQRSNEKCGQLPLLPPVPTDCDPSLSKATMQRIVADYLQTQPADSLRREAMKDSKGDAICLQDLCRLRRQRFDTHGDFPALLTAIRQPLAEIEQNHNAPPPDFFYKMSDAARYVGVTKRTIQNWKKRGWLAVRQDGRKISIARQDLEKCKSKKTS